MTVQRVERRRCDGKECDKYSETDSNHWLVGIVYDGAILIANNRDLLPDIDDSTWNRHLEDVRDFCGEECTIKWVSKMLTEIKNKDKYEEEKS